MVAVALAEILARLWRLEGPTSDLHPCIDALGNSWSGLQRVGPEPLIAAVGEDRRVQVEALFELFEFWCALEPLPSSIEGPEGLVAFIRPRLAAAPTEAFWVASLDARSRVLGFECVSVGTLTACLVHPREVFAPALRIRAASVVVVHNHPSGDPEPSEEDVLLTQRLISAGTVLGIPLVDHLVVARGGVRSAMGLSAA